MLGKIRFLEMERKILFQDSVSILFSKRSWRSTCKAFGLGRLEPVRVFSVKGRHFDHQKWKHLQNPNRYAGSQAGFFLRKWNAFEKNILYLKTSFSVEKKHDQNHLITFGSMHNDM